MHDDCAGEVDPAGAVELDAGLQAEELEEGLHRRDVVGEANGTDDDAHAFFSSVFR